MKFVLLWLSAWIVTGWSQQPVISPGGVVNAASYASGIYNLYSNSNPLGGFSPALASGSIASIFGTNLAATTKSAQSLPLPSQLGGTSVSIDGVPAPLFFVSPTQINFQVPAGGGGAVVVSTASGKSDPFQLLTGPVSTPGIFSLYASGCGSGAVLNVGKDGSVSLNSPSNSARPGDYISIYGTGGGIVSPAVPDGTPAPSNPPARLSVAGSAGIRFFGGGYIGSNFWAGRAPGLVGVDQFNFVVPSTVRTGCSVPLQIFNDNISAPVTISIASGGGPCADPTSQGYGEITWEKTTITTADTKAAVTVAESVTLSLQASPGRQAPTTETYTEGGTLPGAYTYFGPSCPIPGYHSLDAGRARRKVRAPLCSQCSQYRFRAVLSSTSFLKAASLSCHKCNPAR